MKKLGLAFVMMFLSTTAMTAQQAASSSASVAADAPVTAFRANPNHPQGGLQSGGVPFSQRPLLPPEIVIQQCLARSRIPLEPASTPTAETLTPEQWPRLVNCAIAANIRFVPGSISGNPDATVRVHLDSDGGIESIALEQPSTDANWNKAIQHAIDVLPKLPPAPVGRGYQSLALHLRIGTAVQGLSGTTIAPTLQGVGHWSVHDCVSVGGTRTCS